MRAGGGMLLEVLSVAFVGVGNPFSSAFILPNSSLRTPCPSFRDDSSYSGVRSNNIVAGFPFLALEIHARASTSSTASNTSANDDSHFETLKDESDHGEIVLDDGDDEKEETYDYILVGGGASACVLAYRLDKMGYKVLMMERGPHPDEVSDARHVNGWPASWNSNGVKELEYDDGRITIVGNTIGGGTTINVGITWEETPSFFSENLGSNWWSPSDMQEAILQMRKIVNPITLPVDDVSKEFADGLEKAHPEIRSISFDEVNPRSHRSNLIYKTWNTLQEYPQCPGEFYRKGAAAIWSNCNARTKHSVSVERIIFDADQEEELAPHNIASPPAEGVKPRAIGIEYTETAIRGISQEGKRRSKKAYVAPGGEVIICAGTVASPCILMHSGIGPESHLRDLGIHVRLPSEEVGRNYIDRPIVPMFKTIRLPSKHRSLWVPSIATKADTGFIEFTSGNTFECMLTTLPFLPRCLRGLKWVRTLTRFVLKIFRKVIQNAIDQSFILGCSISEVHSRGRIMLRSENPKDPPRIMNKFLSDPRDLEGMKEVIKAARDGVTCAAQKPNSILSTKGSIDIMAKALLLNARLPTTDKKVSNFIKKLSSPNYHIFGTCAVGKVVDETLAVHGVKGLRVCDASIFPKATRLNPQQAIMTMAWRAADIISQTSEFDRSCESKKAAEQYNALAVTE